MPACALAFGLRHRGDGAAAEMERGGGEESEGEAGTLRPVPLAAVPRVIDGRARSRARASLLATLGSRRDAEAIETAVFVLHGGCGEAPEAYGNQIAALSEGARRAPARLRDTPPVELALMHPARLEAHLLAREARADDSVQQFFDLIKRLEDASLAASAGGETFLRCPHCGSRDVMPQVKQTRSADEGGTYFGLCLSPTCGKQYRIRFGRIRLE